jgi:hypothetical protein
MKKQRIEVLVDEDKSIPRRRFTVEIECTGSLFDNWKRNFSDAEYIAYLIDRGLTEQGLERSI